MMPWQAHVMDHALVVGKDGKWASPEVCVVVSRQQGKTHLMKMRILLGLFVFGEKSIAITAQDLKLAREVWEGVLAYIEADPKLRRRLDSVRKTNGQESLTLKDGARLRVFAPTPHAARGYSNDLVLIDELLAQTDFDLWSAIRPTLNARMDATERGPQIWMLSNAGHAGSVLLLQKRQQAIDSIAAKKPAGLAFMEWSAPPEADIDDEAAWAQANPALGRFITLEQIRMMRKGMPEERFRAEQLCQFVDSMTGFLPAGSWELCQSDGMLIPDEAAGEVHFGVDRSPSGDHAAIVAVWPKGQQLFTEVVKEWDAGVSDDSLLDTLADIAGRWRPVTVSGDDRLLGLVLDRFKDAVGYPIQKIRGADRSRSALALSQAVTSRRLVHNGDAMLTDHVSAAARREIGDVWELSRRHSARHITGAMALSFAVYAAANIERQTPLVPSRRGRVA